VAEEHRGLNTKLGKIITIFDGGLKAPYLSLDLEGTNIRLRAPNMKKTYFMAITRHNSGIQNLDLRGLPYIFRNVSKILKTR
jgi:hypothetical protein